MVVRKQNNINIGQIVQIDSWIRLSRPRNPGAKMNMVARMQEIGLFSSNIASAHSSQIDISTSFLTSVINRMPSHSLHIRSH